MAVVDAYDAMSCRRPYKAALTYTECLAELQRCRGTQFDPEMVDAFLVVLEDVARRRARADEIAAEAASRIRGETHAAVLALDDEHSNAYREIEAALREVRDANPPTRFLTTHAQVGEALRHRRGPGGGREREVAPGRRDLRRRRADRRCSPASGRR